MMMEVIVIEYHRRIMAFLKDVEGVENLRFMTPRGHGHPALVFNYKGQERKHSVALSPSRRDAACREINNIKRRLKRLDAGLQGWRMHHE